MREERRGGKEEIEIKAILDREYLEFAEKAKEYIERLAALALEYALKKGLDESSLRDVVSYMYLVAESYVRLLQAVYFGTSVSETARNTFREEVLDAVIEKIAKSLELVREKER